MTWRTLILVSIFHVQAYLLTLFYGLLRSLTWFGLLKKN